MDNFDNEYNTLNQNMLTNKYNTVMSNITKLDNKISEETEIAKKMFEYIKNTEKERTKRTRYLLLSLAIIVTSLPIGFVLSKYSFVIYILSAAALYPAARALVSSFNLEMIRREGSELGFDKIPEKDLQKKYKKSKRVINELKDEVNYLRGVKSNLEVTMGVIKKPEVQYRKKEELNEYIKDPKIVKELKL